MGVGDGIDAPTAQASPPRWLPGYPRLLGRWMTLCVSLRNGRNRARLLPAMTRREHIRRACRFRFDTGLIAVEAWVSPSTKVVRLDGSAKGPQVADPSPPAYSAGRQADDLRTAHPHVGGSTNARRVFRFRRLLRGPHDGHFGLSRHHIRP